jgi:recombinational DNA repair ATPase RecF
MALQTLCVREYRSIKQIYLPLQPINIIVGPNGSGKTNLYRAIYLMHQAAAGGRRRDRRRFGVRARPVGKNRWRNPDSGAEMLERAMTL